MTTASGFIAGTIAAQVVRVSDTTLFHLAEVWLGDATLWYVLADLNGLTDPWIAGIQEISIPPKSGLASNGGIRGL